MSVQTEIDRIISLVDESHEKVKAKGGTTTEPHLLANLPAAIDSIPVSADPVLQSKTVTPGASGQTVTPDTGFDGLAQVTVEGDADLIPENIVSGVSIFGVEGSAETGGGGSAPDTCTVKITIPNGQLFGYFAQCHDGAEPYIASEMKGTNVSSAPILDNVICGSYVVLNHNIYDGGLVSSNITCIKSHNSRGSIWQAPTIPGTQAKIEIGQFSGSGGSD